MRCHPTLLRLTLLGLALLPGQGFSQEADPEPAIDPQARELVHRMSDALAPLQHFDLMVVDTIDDVLNTGQKIQYTHSVGNRSPARQAENRSQRRCHRSGLVERRKDGHNARHRQQRLRSV